MPAKDDLEPVNDLKMAQRYLQYGVEFREPISCYVEDAGLRFDAYLQSVDTEKLLLELETTEESFQKLDSNHLAAVDRPQGDLRLSYSVNEATFFVHGQVQGRSQRRIVVKASMPMYKLQRREALRIKVLDSHKATVQLGGVVHSLFDISAGGLSIVVKLLDEKDFRKQQAFPNSLLRFLGKEIRVDLEVKNVLTHSKDGQKVKVGFRFKNLAPSVEQVIAREAYLHTHKIWSRWL
jgi:c-di-GMP-binding flagellar brake protein YcgR